MLHISIKPDVIFETSILPITNTLLNSYLLIIIFFIVSVYYSYLAKNNPTHFLVFLIRSICKSIYQMSRSILGDKNDRFFSFFISLFLFILLSNWLGLLPGVGSIVIETGHKEVPLLRGATADLNTTLGLALLMVVLIQYYGIIYCGLAGYISKFVSFANPIAVFTSILEIVSEFSKIISFAFRLFGNIFAGEVLIAVIAFLVPVLASLPFLLLELFVGFIQALVFMMLGLVFFQLATTKHN